MRRIWLRNVVLMSLVSGLGACDGDSTSALPPDQAMESNLSFVKLRLNAPPLATTDTSFWAVAGQFQQLVIRQQPQQPGDEGDEFLTFELRPETLYRRPDGTFFAPGDSILIQVSLDPSQIVADFRPSGLEFNPDEQARLELEYEDAEDEFLQAEAQIHLWRQERPGEPWIRLSSIKFEDLDEIEAELLGFTRFALAIGR